jgi:hypothetical protein
METQYLDGVSSFASLEVDSAPYFPAECSGKMQ